MLLYGFENYRNFCLLFIISYIFIKIKIKSRNSQEAQAPWLFKNTGSLFCIFIFLGANDADSIIVEAPSCMAVRYVCQWTWR